ncbi:MAG TPA: ATP-binding protein [Acidimicrobiales bacterium]|nr:ATP-binding protein [Acidimicrobiales bacterium]
MTNHRVVLVDDVPEIRQVLRLILEHAGPFEIVGEGSNGSEAVVLVGELQPDLLVMDVEMRGGPSGWEVLPQIREAAPRTAVVILSGSAIDPLGSERAGLADAVLEKGLPPQELNDALQELLRDPVRRTDTPPGRAVTDGRGPSVGESDAERLHQDLERVTRELEGFASVAGHDLAQPLQVAYGYLEMVRSEFAEGMDPTAAQWIDAAIGSLERMRLLVQDILAFARSGDRNLPPSAVDVEAAARSVIDGLGSFLDERRAEVTLRPPLPTVQGHGPHVSQVLECLVDNAVRFVPSDRVPVVEVFAEEGATEWIITVADNGPGIPLDQCERVFDLFSRGPKSTNSGTGLGLSISRKLVNRMGGRIWVERRPHEGGGAWMRFALPKDLP